MSASRLPECGVPSPRTRGSVGVRLGRGHQGRSIPTCVGLRKRGAYLNMAPPVHPHVRGAQEETATGGQVLSGPSPRAWGSVDPRVRLQLRGRSIPTCVGLRENDLRKQRPLSSRNLHHEATSAPHSSLPHPHRADRHSRTPHRLQPSPHMRGAASAKHGIRWDRQPSPHMRGAGYRRTSRFPERTAIPTHAGSRRKRRTTAARGRSHPHTCGEQPGVARVRVHGQQPSPHMRGAVFLTCNAIPSNPSFLQVVEKQTNPTPLNHPPEHHSPTSLDILVRNRGEGGPDGPTTSGFPAGYRDPARSRPNGADVRAPYPSGRLRYSGGKTAMRSSTSITSTLPRRRAAQMEGSFPHGQLGRGRRPRGIGLLGSAGSVSQKLAIPPRLPRHCVHGTEEAHHHRPSPDRI